jgi:hypothetical protein
MQHFKIEMVVTVGEVGQDGDDHGLRLSGATLSNDRQHVRVSGLLDEYARSLAGHMFGRVRVTIEPVED